MKNVFLLLSLLMCEVTISAENLGVVGKTYPIIEPDLIDVIKGKAQNLIDNGQWAKIQEQTVAKTKDKILNPPSLAGITDAKESATHYFNPSFYLDRDLFDPQGAGKYIDLDKSYKIWFYYDQNGKYTSKLGITKVPSIAYQDGKQIRIDEIPMTGQ